MTYVKKKAFVFTSLKRIGGYAVFASAQSIGLWRFLISVESVECERKKGCGCECVDVGRRVKE